MYSTNPKSPRIFTIDTKYVFQLDQIFILVDFESAQNIFIKQPTSERNTGRAREILNFRIANLFDQKYKIFSPFLSYTEVRIEPKFEDENNGRTLIICFPPFLTCQVSNGFGWSSYICPIEWHQCQYRKNIFITFLC